MVVHKWSEVEAASARLNYGLNVKRDKLAPNNRKSKSKVYSEYKRCPYVHCQREVARIGNHLHQYHKLTGVEYKYMLHQAELVHPNKKNSIVDKEQHTRLKETVEDKCVAFKVDRTCAVLAEDIQTCDEVISVVDEWLV